MFDGYKKQWEFLKNKFKLRQVSHAYLFSGNDIESIKNFAKDFVKLIDCSNKNKPCRECQNCILIEKDNYPELLTIRQEDDKQEIEIKQVRDLQGFLSYKSYYGNFKSVVVENAERMTKEAQNCFLKSLEEPKGKTVIFLISSKPDLLLPTIFSRCQQVKFFYNGKYEASKDDQKILGDLQKVINSDLAEKFIYAKSLNLEEGHLNKILNILQRYFRHLLLARLGVIDLKVQNYSIPKLKRNLEFIENLIYQINTTNINKKLALELLLIEI